MKKYVSPESFEGKKQRAIAVLSQYPSDDKIADLYDHDQEFSGAMIDLFSPGFEYPDYSHLTVGQALAKAGCSSESSTPETIEGICIRLLDSEEHAVESAVPSIAEEAVELIQRLWRQLQSAQCGSAERQWQDSGQPTRPRPSWKYVCEHYGLDESFQYSDKQKEEYYTQLSADASMGAGADLPGKRLWYVVVAAYGAWSPNVPKGMVGVYATQNGELGVAKVHGEMGFSSVPHTCWLVPADEYRARKAPFIIDPDRHTQLPQTVEFGVGAKQERGLLQTGTQCPNCVSSSVEKHPEDGCILAAMIQAIRERESMPEDKLRKLHAITDVNALWNDLGPIIDKLEAGTYCNMEVDDEHDSPSLKV